MDHLDHREEIEVDHPHSYDQTEPKTSLIAILAVVSIIVLLISAFGVQFYFDRAWEHQVEIQQLEPVAQDLVNLRAREDSELNSYKYIDPAKGTVRIPIDRAMELVAKDAAENKFGYPTTASPVKTPEQLKSPGGAAAPAAGTPAPTPAAPPAAH